MADLEATPATFPSFDGARIAVTEIGEGRPVLMLHGYLASAELNWIQPGITAALAAGRRLILPDLRGHGRSAAPTEVEAYPPDVLALDQEALLKHLGISDYDLVGYSLGARTAVRLMARGARPRRCVLGGMGDSGVTDPAGRAAQFESWLTDDPAADEEARRLVRSMVEQRGLSLHAMLGVLKSFVATPPEALAAIDVPTLVVSGARDEDNGSAEALAALLPRARALRTPGNHLSAVAKPELAAAIADFLGEG
jgi:pimeloyl-ACP methyl ester carboxylesterase